MLARCLSTYGRSKTIRLRHQFEDLGADFKEPRKFFACPLFHRVCTERLCVGATKKSFKPGHARILVRQITRLKKLTPRLLSLAFITCSATRD